VGAIVTSAISNQPRSMVLDAWDGVSSHAPDTQLDSHDVMVLSASASDSVHAHD
jgi:hypothetical protein